MAGESSALSIAISHHKAGRLAEAEHAYRQIVASDANQPRAWHLLGVIAHQKGEHEVARTCISRALELNPNDAEAHGNLGTVLQAQGRLDEAAASGRQAVALNPGSASAHFNLGNTLSAQFNFSLAVDCYREAIALLTKGVAGPDIADVRYNLATAFYELGEFDESKAEFEAVLQVRPAWVEAHHNLSNVLMGQGDYAGSAAFCQRALDLQPDFAKAHYNRAVLSLLAGSFELGWTEYEWRWKAGNIPPRELARPEWQGDPLSGQTILLFDEQGMGDTFQFIRFASIVKNLGATVIVECFKPLVPLLTRCGGIDRLIGEGDPLPDFDLHSALLSLPGKLKTRLDSIPAAIPYVFADRWLIDEWRQKLSEIHGFRIGINWQGRTGHGLFRYRDIPLQCFRSLSHLKDLRLISLQKGDGQHDLNSSVAIDLGNNIDTTNGAFMDTAAIMMNLDLVITSDTAIAHLAGALGVPVWVALPFVPDWRWLLDRSDSPWYPTMRLFRQAKPGDWTGVFEKIELELRNWTRR